MGSLIGWLMLRFGIGKRLASIIGYGGLILILAGSAFAITLWIRASEDRDDKTNQDIGAAVELQKGQSRTINQIGEANEAGFNIRNDAGFSRYCQCVRDVEAEFAGSCARYLVNKPLPDRQQDPAKACPRP